VSDNLIADFDQIELEKGVEGFVADLLLTSSRTGQKLLLEISVTHPCDPQKVASGLGIVEIEIRSEVEIEALKQGIDATSPLVRCHNLPPVDAVAKRCSTPCPATGLALLLYRSGKPWYTECKLTDVEYLTSDPHLIAWDIVDTRISYHNRAHSSVINQFQDFVIKQAYHLKNDVKTCILCKHNGGHKNHNDIYCKIQDRIVWASSTATDCKYYLPPLTAEEAEKIFGET
jgi:hypothetical protein